MKISDRASAWWIGTALALLVIGTVGRVVTSILEAS